MNREEDDHCKSQHCHGGQNNSYLSARTSVSLLPSYRPITLEISFKGARRERTLDKQNPVEADLLILHLLKILHAAVLQHCMIRVVVLLSNFDGKGSSYTAIMFLNVKSKMEVCVFNITYLISIKGVLLTFKETCVTKMQQRKFYSTLSTISSTMHSTVEGPQLTSHFLSLREFVSMIIGPLCFNCHVQQKSRAIFCRPFLRTKRSQKSKHRFYITNSEQT